MKLTLPTFPPNTTATITVILEESNDPLPKELTRSDVLRYVRVYSKETGGSTN